MRISIRQSNVLANSPIFDCVYTPFLVDSKPISKTADLFIWSFYSPVLVTPMLSYGGVFKVRSTQRNASSFYLIESNQIVQTELLVLSLFFFSDITSPTTICLPSTCGCLISSAYEAINRSLPSGALGQQGQSTFHKV